MSISRRPYLIRAIHEWICDSEFTPHIVVDATRDDVTVPPDHVSDGKIILNIGAQATEGLSLGNETISFAARFSGNVFSVRVPCEAVLGIYAVETGEGLIFTADGLSPGPDDDDDGGGTDEPDRPTLKVVK